MAEIEADMQIGWVDFSEKERDNVAALLRLLSEEGTVDELGIGAIRDYFSNKLFPGFSVLQTRAKYLVFVPYLFLLAQKQALAKPKFFEKSEEVLAWINKREKEIIGILRDNADKTGKNSKKAGIIGLRNFNRGKGLITWPSQIYWHWFQVFDILANPNDSIIMMCGKIARDAKNLNTYALKEDDRENKGDDHEAFNNETRLFNYVTLPPDLDLKKIEIKLLNDERNMLKGILKGKNEPAKSSLAAYLVEHENEIKDEFQGLDTGKIRESNPDLADTIIYAQEFAKFIYGAHILYNLIFAERVGSKDDVAAISENFLSWCDNTYQPLQNLGVNKIIRPDNFDIRLCKFLRAFDEDIQKYKNGDFQTEKKDITGKECYTGKGLEAVKILIRKREENIKYPKTPRLSTFKQFIPTHYYMLDYRYNVASDIVREVLGLEIIHHDKTKE
jgi:hypothetical protein